MSNVEKPSSDVPIQQKVRDAIHGVVNPDTKTEMATTNRYKEDPHKRMKAAEWHGTKDIRVVDRPAPAVTEPQDAIVKVTVTTVCGSDLHMYVNEVPGLQVMERGDIPGHESCGVIDSVGPGVHKFKVGDRVAISPVISCGACTQCKRLDTSACDKTNPSGEMEMLYGHRTAALLGYSHLTGGYEGCQAEYVRVPIADFNLTPIPDEVSDEVALSATDILNTGTHGVELADVKPGKSVCVWGCGPVGLAAQMMAIQRGAKIVYGVDSDETRLALSKRIGAHPINFLVEKNIPKTLSKLLPGGPDCCIDCVGFRFEKSWSHYFQRALKLETDTPEIVNECIQACAKNGHIALIGDYFNTANGFMIGAFMEKGLTMSGGQLMPHKYWAELIPLLKSGALNPMLLYSHRLPLSDIGKAYAMFNAHEDDCTKIILKTEFGIAQEAKLGHKSGPMGKFLPVDELKAQLPNELVKTPMAA